MAGAGLPTMPTSLSVTTLVTFQRRSTRPCCSPLRRNKKEGPHPSGSTQANEISTRESLTRPYSFSRQPASTITIRSLRVLGATNASM